MKVESTGKESELVDILTGSGGAFGGDLTSASSSRRSVVSQGVSEVLWLRSNTNNALITDTATQIDSNLMKYLNKYFAIFILRATAHHHTCVEEHLLRSKLEALRFRYFLSSPFYPLSRNGSWSFDSVITFWALPRTRLKKKTERLFRRESNMQERPQRGAAVRQGNVNKIC